MRRGGVSRRKKRIPAQLCPPRPAPVAQPGDCLAVRKPGAATALEAKTRLGELLRRVARGEEIVITRHEKPVARIIPEGRPTLADVRRAVGELQALRREMANRRGFKPLTDTEIRNAIKEGRP